MWIKFIYTSWEVLVLHIWCFSESSRVVSPPPSQAEVFMADCLGDERWSECVRDAVPLKMNDLRRKWQFLGDSRCQESFKGQNTRHSGMDFISTSELLTACQLLSMILISWIDPENNTIQKLWHNKRCKQKFPAHFENIMFCTCGRAP